MSDAYIRLYNSRAEEHDDADVIGLSASVMELPTVASEAWDAFFAKRERSCRRMNITNENDRATIKYLGHISWDYYEVHPPLDEATIRKFGSFCAEQMERVDPYVDGYVIDQHEIRPPFQPFDRRGKIIASF